MKLPSLHMTAAAASRDVTLFHAMALLHQASYDMGQVHIYVTFFRSSSMKFHFILKLTITTILVI